MVRLLDSNLPSWLIILLSITFMLIFGYLVALISSYYLPNLNKEEESKKVDSLIATLVGGYIFFLSFTIVNTWSYIKLVQENITKEANALAVLASQSSLFSSDDQRLITSEIKNYIATLLHDEFPNLAHGESSAKTGRAFAHLYNSLSNIKPEGEKESLYYKQLVSTLDQLVQARRTRLAGVESIIPDLLHYILFLGACMVISIAAVFRGARRSIDVISVLVLSGIIGFYFSLAIVFDYPYSSDIGVNTRPYQEEILKQL